MMSYQRADVEAGWRWWWWKLWSPFYLLFFPPEQHLQWCSEKRWRSVCPGVLQWAQRRREGEEEEERSWDQDTVYSPGAPSNRSLSQGPVTERPGRTQLLWRIRGNESSAVQIMFSSAKLNEVIRSFSPMSQSWFKASLPWTQTLSSQIRPTTRHNFYCNRMTHRSQPTGLDVVFILYLNLDENNATIHSPSKMKCISVQCTFMDLSKRK